MKNNIIDQFKDAWGELKVTMAIAIITEQMMALTEMQFDGDPRLNGSFTPEQLASALIDSAGKDEYRKIAMLGLLHEAIIFHTTGGKVTSLEVMGMQDVIDMDDDDTLEGYIMTSLLSIANTIPEFISKLKNQEPIDIECIEGENVVSNVVIYNKRSRRKLYNGSISFEDMARRADEIFA